jgi:hypothetical protein
MFSIFDDLRLPQAHGPPMSKGNEIIEEMIHDYNFFDCLSSLQNRDEFLRGTTYLS